MRQLRWEFAISFISIAVIIGFAMFISVNSNINVSLVGWFIMVFSILALIGILFNELEPSSLAIQPFKPARPVRRPARKKRRR